MPRATTWRSTISWRACFVESGPVGLLVPHLFVLLLATLIALALLLMSGHKMAL